MQLKETLIKNKFIVIAAIAIVVLAVAIALLSTQQAKEEDTELNDLKSFAEETHAGIASRVDELKAIDIQISDDLNAEEKARMELLKKFYNSAVEDFEWIYAEETKNYEKIIPSQDRNEALKLSAKELAFILLQATATVTNHAAITDGLGDDKNGIISMAELYMDSIDYRGLAPTESLSDIEAVDENFPEEVMQEFEGIAAQFVEFKKEKFLNARGEDEKFVEAEKLVEMYFLSLS